MAGTGAQSLWQERAAARRIGVSQPAMSKRLAQLERELQTQLLLRTARGIVLTTAGRAFVARGRVIDAELRKAHDGRRVRPPSTHAATSTRCVASLAKASASSPGCSRRPTSSATSWMERLARSCLPASPNGEPPHDWVSHLGHQQHQLR